MQPVHPVPNSPIALRRRSWTVTPELLAQILSGKDFLLTAEYNTDARTLAEHGSYERPFPKDIEKIESRTYIRNTQHTVRLRLFSEYQLLERAEKSIRAEGYEPADIFTLLTLGRYIPEVQREVPILAAGTQLLCGGITCIPVLRWKYYVHRNLHPVPSAARVLTFEALSCAGGFEKAYAHLCIKKV